MHILLTVGEVNERRKARREVCDNKRNNRCNAVCRKSARAVRWGRSHVVEDADAWSSGLQAICGTIVAMDNMYNGALFWHEGVWP